MFVNSPGLKYLQHLLELPIGLCFPNETTKTYSNYIFC